MASQIKVGTSQPTASVFNPTMRMMRPSLPRWTWMRPYRRLFSIIWINSSGVTSFSSAVSTASFFAAATSSHNFTSFLIVSLPAASCSLVFNCSFDMSGRIFGSTLPRNVKLRMSSAWVRMRFALLALRRRSCRSVSMNALRMSSA